MKVWSKVKEGRAGIVLSLCFSFLVMIYAPLEMFFYNTDDFWFNFTTIFPVCFTLFFLLWMIGSLFFVLLNTLNRQIYYIGFLGHLLLWLVLIYKELSLWIIFRLWMELILIGSNITLKIMKQLYFGL